MGICIYNGKAITGANRFEKPSHPSIDSSQLKSTSSGRMLLKILTYRPGDLTTPHHCRRRHSHEINLGPESRFLLVHCCALPHNNTARARRVKILLMFMDDGTLQFHCWTRKISLLLCWFAVYHYLIYIRRRSGTKYE